MVIWNSILKKESSNTRLLSKQFALFYAAELVLALEYLHSINIIHRDLKPANLMIDSNCHLKLTDFGISEIDCDALKKEKKEGDRCFGTLEYLAPEVLAGEPHGKEVDYWSLGCIIFQLLTGYTPFLGSSIDETRENIENVRINWPRNEEGAISLPKEAFELISMLLKSNPDDRLGSISIDEIKNHPFFLDIDFTTIRNKTIKIGLENQLEENEKPKDDKETAIEETMFNLKNLQNVRYDLLHKKNLDLVDDLVRKAKKTKESHFGVQTLIEDLNL